MSDAPGHSDNGEDDDLVAAEYALGVLDAAERRHVERRLRVEPALLARVEGWEARLSPMLAAVEPVEAPPGAWAVVERDLDRMLRFRAPAPAAPAAPGTRVSRAWKWFGLGSFGLLAASLAALFVAVQPPGGGSDRDRALAAVIAPASGAVLYAAVVDAAGTRATLVPVNAPALSGRARELWAIAPDARPRSLGVLPEGAGPVRVALPPGLVADGYTLAVSEEPPGGSPTGLPTGPVVGTGALGAI